jgi:hypothetical protein
VRTWPRNNPEVSIEIKKLGLDNQESKNCSRQRNIDGTLEQNEDSTSKNLSSETDVLKNK